MSAFWASRWSCEFSGGLDSVDRCVRRYQLELVGLRNKSRKLEVAKRNSSAQRDRDGATLIRHLTGELSWWGLLGPKSGRSPFEIGRLLSTIIYRVDDTYQVVVWDFWSINHCHSEWEHPRRYAQTILRQSQQPIPSLKLIIHSPKTILKTMFPFLKVGFCSFLGGKYVSNCQSERRPKPMLN